VNKHKLFLVVCCAVFMIGFSGSGQTDSKKKEMVQKKASNSQEVNSGFSKTYYPSGAINEEIDLRDGTDNKTVTKFNEDGTLHSITIYRNGKSVDQSNFDIKKNKNSSVEKPKNGKKMWKWTDKSGNVRSTETEPNWEDILPEDANTSGSRSNANKEKIDDTAQQVPGLKAGGGSSSAPGTDYEAMSKKQIVVQQVPTKGIPGDIFSAVDRLDMELLRELLRQDPKRVHQVDKDGLTPLHQAALHGNIKAVELLLSSGADINKRAIMNTTPLHWAVASHNTDIVRLLLDKGADINAINASSSIDIDIRPGTALHMALAVNMSDIIELLLARGALINLKNTEGNTPLHIACRGERLLHYIPQLLAKGADTAAKNNKGLTPFEAATDMNLRKELAAVLQKTGYSVPDTKVTVDELISAIYHCGYKYPHPPDCPGATEIIENNPKLATSHGSLGQTALHIASGQHLKGTCALLLDSGADVDARDDKGKTPLFNSSDDEIRKFLIDSGADVNAQDKQGRSPLFELASLGMCKFARILIENGADVNVRDKAGMTPLKIALQNRRNEMVELLRGQGATE